jgi:hypothetical protein
MTIGLRWMTCLCTIITWSASASAQTGTGEVRAALAPEAVLAALAVDAATVQELSLPPSPTGPFTVRVAIGGSDVELRVAPHDVRAPGFQLLVQGPDGVLRNEDAPPPATVRGVVAGSTDSVVAGSLADNRLTALVVLDGRLFGIQPIEGLVAGAPPTRHAVYAVDAVRPWAAECLAIPTGDGRAPAGAGDGASGLKVAEIAFDSDVEFFNSFGTVEATEQDIEAVFNAVDAIYREDTGVIHLVTAIIVRPSEPDPYDANDPSTALAEFSTEWQTNQAGIPRDLAQLFTGKPWDGLFVGLAFVGGNLCNVSTQYSVVRSLFTPALGARDGPHLGGHALQRPARLPDHVLVDRLLRRQRSLRQLGPGGDRGHEGQRALPGGSLRALRLRPRAGQPGHPDRQRLGQHRHAADADLRRAAHRAQRRPGGHLSRPGHPDRPLRRAADRPAVDPGLHAGSRLHQSR